MHRHAEHEEKTVLGAVMVNGLPAIEACIRLRPEHFVLEIHQRAWRACIEILASNIGIGVDVVARKLNIGIGSSDWIYLDSLTEGVYRGYDPSGRVEAILEAWRHRRVIQACHNAVSASNEGLPAAEVLSSMHAEVLSIVDEAGEHDEPLVSAYSEAAWESLMERAFASESTGLSYGCFPLDQWTNGMQPGRVTAIGARSGVGKTSLMKQAAVANCRAGKPVSLFSLESSREEILNGLWAIVSGVAARRIERANTMSLEEREHVQKAKNIVHAWPLRIYDKADLHIDQICAYARKDIRQHGTKLIAVDYAQSVESDGKDERTRVAKVSRMLTKLTKDEGNSLMLLSQLRKMPVEHYSKPPTMADFRETGQIENDAHVGLLLHRPWDEDRCCISDEASIHVGKFRHGRTGALRVKFNADNLCFEGAA